MENKIYPYLIIFPIFLSVLLLFLLIWPKYQNLSSLNKEISKKELEFQSQEEYFQNLKDISERLKEYQESLSKIDSALPSNPSLPELCNFLQKTSSQSGLSLKEISPSSIATGGEEIKESKVNLTLAGSYPSFKNFLSVLEKSARMIELEKISFSSPKKETESFDFDLIIKVYSY